MNDRTGGLRVVRPCHAATVRGRRQSPRTGAQQECGDAAVWTTCGPAQRQASQSTRVDPGAGAAITGLCGYYLRCARAWSRAHRRHVGWLEFVRVDASIVLRTRVESTQSSRQALTHWASGLETAHLQSALARAPPDISGATMATA